MRLLFSGAAHRLLFQGPGISGTLPEAVDVLVFFVFFVLLIIVVFDFLEVVEIIHAVEIVEIIHLDLVVVCPAWAISIG